MKTLFIALVILLLTSCTTVHPIAHEFDAEKSFEVPEPIVWKAIMDFFTRNQLQIKTLERASGVVYAEHKYIGTQDAHLLEWAADCGTYPLMQPGAGNLSLNMFLSENLDKVNVRVNANYSKRWILSNPMLGIYSAEILPCTSRGTLEDSIFQYIDNYIEELVKATTNKDTEVA